MADTFDLTDDIPLSQNGVEQALLSEEIREEVILVLVLGAQILAFSAPPASNAQTVQLWGLLPFPLQSALPLYQRVSTYRI